MSAPVPARRIDAAAEWRSPLTITTCAGLLFLTASGLLIYLLPFSLFSQVNVLTHTLAGLLLLLPTAWYAARHWLVRRHGNLSHYQLFGYIAVALLAACAISGIVITWQGALGARMHDAWQLTHLLTGIAMPVLLAAHLLTLIVRRITGSASQQAVLAARRRFYAGSLAGGGALLAVTIAWTRVASEPPLSRAFPGDYNWTFGEDRPFSPSLARTDDRRWREGVQRQVLDLLRREERSTFLAGFRQVEKEPIGLFAQIRAGLAPLDLGEDRQSEVTAIFEREAAWMRSHGAIDSRALTGSERCGSCHREIYEEWLPSAHRYSSMDDLFQKVQELMVLETSAEATRYCAGCHDPISLFGGAKNSGNITLSAEGAHEGISCITCHSIVQADVQGNADYTIESPRHYLYELSEHPVARFVSDFLIRTHPQHHVRSYSRPLYKTAEYCGACHKQYMDVEINTDIGKVQGQNQYDSWLQSRWHVPDHPDATVNCRECHMPLHESADPARGDRTDVNRTARDGRHRSHRFLGGNQYIPLVHDLEGAAEHVRLTEAWLRGEIEIPEIAGRWTDGPVVRMIIDAPESARAGEEIPIQVLLVNNKTGHDFPTGPLDMIESWVEIIVRSEDGRVLHHSGGLDEGELPADALAWFKADGFDRKGGLIDRHNLWDLVGKSYARSLYPGMTDTLEVSLRCPSMARGRVSPADVRHPPGQREQRVQVPADEPGVLYVEAVLWYRKANPAFVRRVYGVDSPVRSPLTDISRASTTIRILEDRIASIE